jgi:hypothetical protein
MNIEVLLDQLDKQDKIFYKKFDSILLDVKRKETEIIENLENKNNLYIEKLQEVFIIF